MSRAYADLLAVYRQARRNDGTVEGALGALRRAGANAIDSLKILCKVEHLRLGEAKLILDGSLAWKDRRVVNEALRDAAAESLVEEPDATE